ncbi:hypothetical protein EYC84_006379 [Monilinia fructicola]|uniref:Uncharacterized protein n=1 Tax=Monilinia fructicola TaxID=38448 RepID=A0A5M9K353_MONFR|nr:hypothetical protein EYC84_006379 [Monilinia fructicola]
MQPRTRLDHPSIQSIHAPSSSSSSSSSSLPFQVPLTRSSKHHLPDSPIHLLTYTPNVSHPSPKYKTHTQRLQG